MYIKLYLIFDVIVLKNVWSSNCVQNKYFLIEVTKSKSFCRCVLQFLSQSSQNNCFKHNSIYKQNFCTITQYLIQFHTHNLLQNFRDFNSKKHNALSWPSFIFLYPELIIPDYICIARDWFAWSFSPSKSRLKIDSRKNKRGALLICSLYPSR